jgi:hypothetical protein
VRVESLECESRADGASSKSGSIMQNKRTSKNEMDTASEQELPETREVSCDEE